MYRKRPHVVDAFQMTKQRRTNNEDWPNWLHQAWQKEPHEDGAVFSMGDGDDRVAVTVTGGSQVVVAWNEWIVCGVEGELYPCADSVFRASYESVDIEPVNDAHQLLLHSMAQQLIKRIRFHEQPGITLGRMIDQLQIVLDRSVQDLDWPNATEFFHGLVCTVDGFPLRPFLEVWYYLDRESFLRRGFISRLVEGDVIVNDWHNPRGHEPRNEIRLEANTANLFAREVNAHKMLLKHLTERQDQVASQLNRMIHGAAHQ